MQSSLNLSQVNELRNTEGKSALLFMTDRCPVGCAHCSVDSRADSPTIEDFDKFGSIVEGLCQRDELELVGISGGEPFVERRGLTLAVDRLSKANKAIALYTSGVWANPKHAAPPWIRSVLARATCVFLSTDAYHAASVSDSVFCQAAQTIVDAGPWLIVQVLDQPGVITRATELLASTLGESWEDHAELSLVPPLPYGRANELFTITKRHAPESFGICGSLAAPVVRYDGKVIACCNEAVLMGKGPDRLRQMVQNSADLDAALDTLSSDPLLDTMRKIPIGGLIHHPRYSKLKDQTFKSACEACWAIQELAPELGDRSDPILNALTMMEGAAA